MDKNREAILQARQRQIDHINKASHSSSDAEEDDIEKARAVGEMHSNGKWVWTEYKPGKFDWRGIPAGQKKADNESKPSAAAPKAVKTADDKPAKKKPVFQNKLEKQIFELEEELRITKELAKKGATMFMDSKKEFDKVMKRYGVKDYQMDKVYVDHSLGLSDKTFYNLIIEADFTKLSDRQRDNLSNKLKEVSTLKVGRVMNNSIRLYHTAPEFDIKNRN